MIKILSKIQINQEFDTSFIISDQHETYIDQILKDNKNGIPDLQEVFPKSSEDMIDILKQMLQFNPHFRPTTEELLKHKIFDDIHTEQQLTSPHKVQIDIDKNDIKLAYGVKNKKEMDKPEQIMQIKVAVVKEYLKLNQIDKKLSISFAANLA